jgi:hypothetical protein
MLMTQNTVLPMSLVQPASSASFAARMGTSSVSVHQKPFAGSTGTCPPRQQDVPVCSLPPNPDQQQGRLCSVLTHAWPLPALVKGPACCLLQPQPLCAWSHQDLLPPLLVVLVLALLLLLWCTPVLHSLSPIIPMSIPAARSPTDASLTGCPAAPAPALRGEAAPRPAKQHIVHARAKRARQCVAEAA